MADKVETTDKEGEKHIKKAMEGMKKRYDTVNEKMWSLETRMETMSKEQAESSGAIQSKLVILLRNSCIDTWVEVMRLDLERDNLNNERLACKAILSKLEGTALKCVVAKKEEERDTADKIFEILLNQFRSGMKGHQPMMRFKKEMTKRWRID